MSKNIQSRYTTKSFSLFMILVIFSLTIAMYLHLNYVSAQQIFRNNTNTLTTSSHSLNPPVIVDPNSNLIDKKSDNLINNVTLVSNINSIRNGTIADGVSKLLLISIYNNPINISIANNDANFSKGTLRSLSDNSNNSQSTKHSSVIIKPVTTTNGKSVVVAVYTPPTISTAIPPNKTNGTVKILLYDTTNPSANSEVPISLYRVPVVLVHGIWTNSTLSWVKSNFSSALEKLGYNVSLADYGRYNATTFDPISISNKGNYGIDSMRNITKETLHKYHDNGIAASQVDVVAHSMGGLMARGFTQQADYKNLNNSMQGYIHRLITIGTPHYGGNLAKILIDHQNNYYCVSSFPPYLFNPLACGFFAESLKTIYSDLFKLPIALPSIIYAKQMFHHMRLQEAGHQMP
jgi:pimeloyl-ACP methyl ester carboxylesterase